MNPFYPRELFSYFITFPNRAIKGQAICKCNKGEKNVVLLPLSPLDNLNSSSNPSSTVFVPC